MSSLVDAPVVTENPPPFVPSASPQSQSHRDEGIQLEGSRDNMDPNANPVDSDIMLRLEGSRPNDTRYPSITIAIFKAILHPASFISSLVAVERHHIIPIITVLIVEWCFLKLVGWSYKDVLSAIFITSLLGRFAYHVWAKQKRLYRKLDDVSGKIEALPQAMKSLQPIAVVRSPRPDRSVEGRGRYLNLPVSREVRAHSIAMRTLRVMGLDSEPGSQRPVASVDTDRPPTPYNVPTPESVETPVITENHSPTVPPAVAQPHPSQGANLEGLGDNTAEVPDPEVEPEPVTLPEVKQAFSSRLTRVLQVRRLSRSATITSTTASSSPTSLSSEFGERVIPPGKVETGPISDVKKPNNVERGRFTFLKKSKTIDVQTRGPLLTKRTRPPPLSLSSPPTLTSNIDSLADPPFSSPRLTDSPTPLSSSTTFEPSQHRRVMSTPSASSKLRITDRICPRREKDKGVAHKPKPARTQPYGPPYNWIPPTPGAWAVAEEADEREITERRRKRLSAPVVASISEGVARHRPEPSGGIPAPRPTVKLS